MPDEVVKAHDIFLSYSHENRTWVKMLYERLHQRRVRAVLDEQFLGGGDVFGKGLIEAIRQSRTFGLVMTPEIHTSDWVRKECETAREQYDLGHIKLIPLKRAATEIPEGFKSHNYIDFSQDSELEWRTDRLIWPGITGKRVRAVFVNAESTRMSNPAWDRLIAAARDQDVDVDDMSGLIRVNNRIDDLLRIYPQDRIVIFVDPFEEHTIGQQSTTHPPRDYLDFIQHYRMQTKWSSNPIKFVLYERSDAWDGAVHDLGIETVNEFKQFFRLYQNIPDNTTFNAAFRSGWTETLRELFVAERV